MAMDMSTFVLLKNFSDSVVESPYFKEQIQQFKDQSKKINKAISAFLDSLNLKRLDSLLSPIPKPNYPALFATYCDSECLNEKSLYTITNMQHFSVKVLRGNLFLKDDRMCQFNSSLRTTESDTEIVNELYAEFSKTIRIKRFTQKKFDLFHALLASVLSANRHSVPKAVVYSRNEKLRNGKSNPETKPLVAITNFLADKGLIINVIGSKGDPKAGGNAGSWIVATNLLKAICSRVKTDSIFIKERKNIVQVKDKEKNLLPLSNFDPDMLFNAASSVNAHNDCWTGHFAKLYL